MKQRTARFRYPFAFTVCEDSQSQAGANYGSAVLMGLVVGVCSWILSGIDDSQNVTYSTEV